MDDGKWHKVFLTYSAFVYYMIAYKEIKVDHNGKKMEKLEVAAAA